MINFNIYFDDKENFKYKFWQHFKTNSALTLFWYQRSLDSNIVQRKILSIARMCDNMLLAEGHVISLDMSKET